MRAVGLVVGCRGGLQHPLQVIALAFLAFDLIFQQRDLAGQLAVGVVGLVRFDLGIANAALDDRLINNVSLGGSLNNKAKPDEHAFDGSKHSRFLSVTSFLAVLLLPKESS